MMGQLEQYLQELTEKANTFLDREYNFESLDISSFEAINFYLLHQAISEEKNLFIGINDKKYKNEIYRPSFLTIAILLFFKNYCDDITAFNPGDILQKGKKRYKYVKKNLDGSHHLRSSEGDYPEISSKSLKSYSKVNAHLSNRKVKTGLNHYKDFFNFVFKNLGKDLPSEFKYKAAIILDKKIFLEELKNQSFTDINLLKAIPFQWVNKNGKFELPQIPIDPMIYLAPDYETVQEYILDSEIEIESVVFIGKNKYNDDSFQSLRRDLRDETVPFSIIIGSEDIKDEQEQFIEWSWTSEEMAFLNDSQTGRYEINKIAPDLFYKNILDFELFINHLEKVYSIELENFNGIKKLLYSLVLPNIDGRGTNQIDYLRYLIEREYYQPLKNELETQNIDPEPVMTELKFEIEALFNSFSNKKLEAIARIKYDYLIIPNRFEDIWKVETGLNVKSFKSFERQILSYNGKKKFLFLSPFMNGISASDLFKFCKNNNHDFIFLCYPEESEALEALNRRWSIEVSNELNSTSRRKLCGIPYPQENKTPEPENITKLIGRISSFSRKASSSTSWETQNSVNYKILFSDGDTYILDANKSVLLEENSSKNRVRVGNLRLNDSVRIYANPTRELLFESAKNEDQTGRFERIEKHALLWKKCLREYYQNKSAFFTIEDLLKELTEAGISIRNQVTLTNWLSENSSIRFPMKKNDLIVINKLIGCRLLDDNLNDILKSKETYNGIMIALGRDLSDEIMDYILTGSCGSILSGYTPLEIEAMIDKAAPLKIINKMSITEEDESE